MIIDSHAHLNTYEDVEQVIKDANDSKVDTIVSISTDLDSSRKNIQIAEKYRNVFCAVGIHPCDVKNHSISDLGKIEELSYNQNAKAIGEVGLDFYYTKEDLDNQYEFLNLQIDIANRRNLPVVIHARDSYPELIDYIKSSKIKSDFVVHCFTGDKIVAKEFLDLGSYISFTGIVTFKKSNDLREIASYIPEDKIMIETDSPYLSPHPKRGKTNYPKNLIYIAECIAKEKKIHFENFCANLKKNTVKFYRL